MHTLERLNWQAPYPIDDLMELLRDCVEHGASVGFVLPVTDDELRDYWQSVLADLAEGARIMLVAQQDGRVVGSVQLALATKRNGAHRAEVQKLLVHTSARRQGIAQALMEAIEAMAREENRSLLVLDTVENQPAEKLYLKWGYIESGRIPKYAIAPDGNSIETTVVMYKFI